MASKLRYFNTVFPVIFFPGNFSIVVEALKFSWDVCFFFFDVLLLSSSYRLFPIPLRNFLLFSIKCLRSCSRCLKLNSRKSPRRKMSFKRNNEKRWMSNVLSQNMKCQYTKCKNTKCKNIKCKNTKCPNIKCSNIECQTKYWISKHWRQKMKKNCLGNQSLYIGKSQTICVY